MFDCLYSCHFFHEHISIIEELGVLWSFSVSQHFPIPSNIVLLISFPLQNRLRIEDTRVEKYSKVFVTYCTCCKAYCKHNTQRVVTLFMRIVKLVVAPKFVTEKYRLTKEQNSTIQKKSRLDTNSLYCIFFKFYFVSVYNFLRKIHWSDHVLRRHYFNPFMNL
jgi:hypothetical protein